MNLSFPHSAAQEKLVQRLKDVQQELAKVRRAREDLRMLPVPPAEFAAHLAAIIHVRLHTLRSAAYERLRPALHRPDRAAHREQLEKAVDTLLEISRHERLEEDLAQVLTRMDYPFGAPWQERQGELQRLADRIRELEIEEKHLKLEYNAAGGPFRVT